MAKFIEIHHGEATLLLRPQDIMSLGADDDKVTNMGILLGGVTPRDVPIPLDYNTLVDRLTAAFDAIGEKFEIGALDTND